MSDYKSQMSVRTSRGYVIIGCAQFPDITDNAKKAAERFPSLVDYYVANDLVAVDDPVMVTSSRSAENCDPHVYTLSVTVNDIIDAAQSMPRALYYLPGVKLLYNDNTSRVEGVDMDLDEYEYLFGETETGDLSDSRRLVRALKRSAIAAVKHINDGDGGTCNFDSPALSWKECGMRKSTVEAAIKEAGLRWYEWSALKMLVVTGFQWGQGDRRTNMAEAFSANLESEGYGHHMYYAMD